MRTTTANVTATLSARQSLRYLRLLTCIREERAYMHALDQSYLDFVLNDPTAHMIISQEMSYAYADADPAMLQFRLRGQLWKITFNTSRKCPGLKLATLVHDRLAIMVREQNPTKATPQAKMKASGHEVFQIFVNDEPQRFLLDGAAWEPESFGQDRLRKTS